MWQNFNWQVVKPKEIFSFYMYLLSARPESDLLCNASHHFSSLSHIYHLLPIVTVQYIIQLFTFTQKWLPYIKWTIKREKLLHQISIFFRFWQLVPAGITASFSSHLLKTVFCKPSSLLMLFYTPTDFVAPGDFLAKVSVLLRCEGSQAIQDICH